VCVCVCVYKLISFQKIRTIVVNQNWCCDILESWLHIFENYPELF